MGSNIADPITELLIRWNAGEETCRDRLIPLLEHELHRIAHHHMQKEREGHTLQTTALVNEAYLKLVDQSRATWTNRAHFLAVASGIMRHFLVDHARGLCRERRGGAKLHLPLNEDLVFSPAKSAALVALDDALENLSRLNPRKAQVVELRYFGGLSVEEAAAALGVHPNTIIRDWSLARAWLKRELARGAAVAN
jgi:RNA polymerase sigma factor (TIGR02999 family)